MSRIEVEAAQRPLLVVKLLHLTQGAGAVEHWPLEQALGQGTFGDVRASQNYAVKTLQLRWDHRF